MLSAEGKCLFNLWKGVLMNIFIFSITGLRFNLISHIRECGSVRQPQGTHWEEKGATKHVLNWLASCWHQNGWQLSQTNPKRNTFNHLSLGMGLKTVPYIWAVTKNFFSRMYLHMRSFLGSISLFFVSSL